MAKYQIYREEKKSYQELGSLIGNIIRRIEAELKLKNNDGGNGFNDFISALWIELDSIQKKRETILDDNNNTHLEGLNDLTKSIEINIAELISILNNGPLDISETLNRYIFIFRNIQTDFRKDFGL